MKPPFFRRLRVQSLSFDCPYDIIANECDVRLISKLSRRRRKNFPIPPRTMHSVIRRRNARKFQAIHQRKISIFRSRGNATAATEYFFGF